MCDNVVTTVRFSLLKLVKFSFLFFFYLLLVFITPVNKDIINENDVIIRIAGIVADDSGWI